MDKTNSDILKEFDEKIHEHYKRLKKIENTLLNIHYNSDMWLKIQKIEQDLIKIKTQINFREKEEDDD